MFRLARMGYVRVKDFFDHDGRLIQGRDAIRNGIPTILQAKWQKVIRVLRTQNWKKEEIKLAKKIPTDNITNLCINGENIEGNQITQKKILNARARVREYTLSKAQVKINDRLQSEKEDWLKAIKNIKTHSICTNKRSKYFRMYAGITYTNKAYYRFGHKSSAKCTYCEEPKQDFIHLFIDCPEIKKFKNELLEIWNVNINDKEWFFGSDEECLSFLTKEANLYIHARNWAEKQLNFRNFQAHIASMEKIEADIAERRHKLDEHVYKWSDRLEKMKIE